MFALLCYVHKTWSEVIWSYEAMWQICSKTRRSGQSWVQGGAIRAVQTVWKIVYGVQCWLMPWHWSCLLAEKVNQWRSRGLTKHWGELMPGITVWNLIEDTRPPQGQVQGPLPQGPLPQGPLPQGPPIQELLPATQPCRPQPQILMTQLKPEWMRNSSISNLNL